MCCIVQAEKNIQSHFDCDIWMVDSCEAKVFLLPLNTGKSADCKRSNNQEVVVLSRQTDESFRDFGHHGYSLRLKYRAGVRMRLAWLGMTTGSKGETATLALFKD